MPNQLRSSTDISNSETGAWLALGAGAILLAGTVRARPLARLCLAAVSAPLLYRGLTGQWPEMPAPPSSNSDTRIALGGARGIHVRESVRVERPASDVYRFWRRLENLPRFMTHLTSVTETSEKLSHWVAKGPGGMPIEWDAEVINEVLDKTIAWRSVGKADVVSAGSVTFRSGPGDRSTTVSVNLQYSPPAGRAGEWVAQLLSSAPSQTIREDLQRLKTVVEEPGFAPHPNQTGSER